jgi:hypothetical protein
MRAFNIKFELYSNYSWIVKMVDGPSYERNVVNILPLKVFFVDTTTHPLEIIYLV